MTTPLSNFLLPQAANNRHGLVFAPQTAKISKSDVPDIFHVGVPFSQASPWKSASGGVSRDHETAALAAIGEGVERYCAALADVPAVAKAEISGRVLDAEQWTLFSAEQRHRPDFPFTKIYEASCAYTTAHDFVDGNEWWVPHPLVVLRDDYATGLPTSSGLAAGATPSQAALRALQELIERDALMATWLHSVPGRAIRLPRALHDEVSRLYGTAHVFDLTPRYSPFPVIAVAGGIPQRGTWRFSLGVACRETLDQAIDKAFLEWCQGVFFAGIYPKYVQTDHLSRPDEVRSFDDHAIFYTQNPAVWHELPLLKDRHSFHKPSRSGNPMNPTAALQQAVTQLSKAGIKLLYKDLTTIDALQAGVRVMRVLSPDLMPINAHHAWPFLGGTASDIGQRYDWATSLGVFPNPYPHPLG